jgi:2-dehydro-3-deoxyphosphogluconate aldolase/(4S)-4-hydroxy-2-oxoglutarate aldolase
MERHEVTQRIREIGIVPAIRVDSPEDALFAAASVLHGGIPIVEVTMTIPGALEVIAELVRCHPRLLVGAGTVFSIDVARDCVAAGAHYLTSPGLDPELAQFAAREKVTFLPGALTPTEVWTACKAGCDMVKIFPCSHVGGPKYIRALQRPFPHVPLIASGGVNQHTAADFIRAGAAALGIGGALIPPEAIEHRHADHIHELARRFLEAVRTARAHLQAEA